MDLLVSVYPLKSALQPANTLRLNRGEDTREAADQSIPYKTSVQVGTTLLLPQPPLPLLSLGYLEQT